MGEGRHEREARDLCDRYGKPIRQTLHGVLYEFPGPAGVPAHYTLSGQSSDRVHGWRNSRAAIRRILRAAGIEPGPDQDEEDDDVAEVFPSTVAVPQRSPVETDPAVYVRRKTVRIESEVMEAIVPGPVLLRLLGLGELPEGGTLILTDVAGRTFDASGPLTVRVEGPAVHAEFPHP